MSVDEGSPPLSPQYEELVEVVTRAVAKLVISWPPEETSVPQTFVCMSGFCARGKKKKKKKPLYRSLRFFPRSPHRGVEIAGHTNLVPPIRSRGDARELNERGYRTMPRAEQSLASSLSPGAASSLKAPTLPTEPLRVIICG
jgi:hypothetical protein